jgi:ectoine hydroxylase-related dioxygenase (phytanoyl-CoA dioxygenase family)
MKKGSVALWLSRTLHGASKSSAQENRTGYLMSYIADWIRQEENQYIVLPEDRARGYSQQARQLIGYRSSPNLGWVKGRDADNLLEPGQSGHL